MAPLACLHSMAELAANEIGDKSSVAKETSRRGFILRICRMFKPAIQLKSHLRPVREFHPEHDEEQNGQGRWSWLA